MTTSVLHVSETLYDENEKTEEASLGGLTAAVDQATNREVDAVLHTGNLFQRPSPSDEAIDKIASPLEKLDAEEIEFFVVPGRRDLAGSVQPLKRYRDEGLATRLTTNPSILDDEIALYGLPYEDDDSFAGKISSGELTLESTNGRFYHVLCTHQQIWPPHSEEDAAISAYDLMNGVDEWIDTVAAGGSRKPRSWHSDQVDYHVFYPGTTNPGYTPASQDPHGFLYTVSERENLSYQRVPLTSSEPTEEVDELRSFIRTYESSSLEGASVETLADLYALLAEGKSMLDDRRKTVRDIILEQTAPDSSIRGSVGEVYHQEYTRRSVKDEEEVIEVLDANGIAPSEVMTESIDSDRLEEVAENAEIPQEDVFDEKTVTTARKGDVTLGPE